MSVTVVLVRTFSPGNLGASARAARCFGASLALVDPRADRTHGDASAFASGAEGLLEAATVLSSLEELATSGAFVVALTSLRGRSARGLPPATTWPALRRRATKGNLALVFGPERGGLTAGELRLCAARLSLRTDPAFPTLSLPQAVTAALALLGAGRVPAPSAGDPRRAEELPVSPAVLAVLRARLGVALGLAGWPGPGRPAALVAEIESLLLRARPTAREATLLLGALEALASPRRR